MFDNWKTPKMGQANAWFLKKIRPNISDLLEFLKPEDSLLDVGCFHGHLYQELGHKNYTGLDLFPEHIAEARKLNPGVPFLVGDLFELEGRWDVIFCCRVLMHIPDLEKAVESLRRCAPRVVLVVPIGEPDLRTESIDGETVYYQVFSRERFKGAEVRMHSKYSTVIYGPRLP